MEHYETTSVKLRGKEVKIHALSTGTVAMKTSAMTKKGFGGLSKLNIMLDKEFTDYMPIWVWVIEHPDGLVVIDTGETSAIKNLKTFLAKERSLHRYMFSKVARFEIEAQDELDAQFEKIKLKTKDVKLVVLTHLHLDHTDGLRFFPKAEVIVGKHEYEHAEMNMPSTYPTWLKPNKVIYWANQVDIFDKAYRITNDLYYVPTPGHTAGQSSIILKTDQGFDILFAGDTSSTQEQVIRGEFAGANADFKKSAETYRNILAYASKRKTIYLPSHDKNSALRLRDRVFIE
ncbi:MAG: N-acyl homoserine lactonase family protein [Flavisolibacter sp.]